MKLGSQRFRELLHVALHVNLPRHLRGSKLVHTSTRNKFNDISPFQVIFINLNSLNC